MRAKCENGCFDVDISERLEAQIRKVKKFHVCTTCLGNVIIYSKEDGVISSFLEDLADNLEPKTHCCECAPGEHFERHMVHIQYANCTCDPEGESGGHPRIHYRSWSFRWRCGLAHCF